MFRASSELLSSNIQAGGVGIVLKAHRVHGDLRHHYQIPYPGMVPVMSLVAMRH